MTKEQLKEKKAKIELLKKAINSPNLTLDIILRWTHGEDYQKPSIQNIYHHTDIWSEGNKLGFTVMKERKSDIETYYWYLTEEIENQSVEIIDWLVELIPKLSHLNSPTPIKAQKLYYFKTSDLSKEAIEEWKGYSDHNNGYAVKWLVVEPEQSGYPEIEKFFISKGIKIGEEVVLHSTW